MTDNKIMPPDGTPVDPARLEPGKWCHRTEKTVGEGDIAASYSADRIGMDRPVRTPFRWKAALWICVSMTTGRGRPPSAEAYRLVPPRFFDGEAVTYTVKTVGGETARADPNGFYHGMAVKHGGESFVLCGPPETFIAGETEQLALF